MKIYPWGWSRRVCRLMHDEELNGLCLRVYNEHICRQPKRSAGKSWQKFAQVAAQMKTGDRSVAKQNSDGLKEIGVQIMVLPRSRTVISA